MGYTAFIIQPELSPAMGARNRVGVELLYHPASLCSLASQFHTGLLESIPSPIAEPEFGKLEEMILGLFKTLQIRVRTLQRRPLSLLSCINPLCSPPPPPPYR
jgi:hypothetical protein